jgi:hypothetical protein
VRLHSASLKLCLNTKLAKVEVTDRDKYSSLLRDRINYGRNFFNSTGPWSIPFTMETFPLGAVTLSIMTPSIMTLGIMALRITI